MKRLISFIIMGICANVALAQDPHFSFYSAVPVGLNPANTGNFNGNFRISGQYRNQWNSILGSEAEGAYKTATASLEARTNRGLDEHDFVGVGAVFLYDVAGQSRLSNLKFALSASYRKALDAYGDHFISVGAQVGVIQKRINTDGLTWGTQWDGTQYQQHWSSQETGLDNNVSFYDVSAGINWGYNIFGTRNRFYAGLAFMHINQPSESFYGNSNGGTATLPMRINFNAGAGIQVSSRLDVIPKVLVMKQGQNLETMFGGEVRFLFDPTDDFSNSFYLGVLGRAVGGDPNVINSQSLNFESVVATARYEYNRMEIGAAYDFNVSQLRYASNYQGGFEVFFNYIFKLESNRQAKLYCPKF